VTDPRPNDPTGDPRPDDEATRADDETTLAAGAPGPSGTGEQTTAGADPDAPAQTTGEQG